MNMNRICDDKERLLAYLYDEGEPSDRAVVREHLASCAACRSELEGLRTTRAHLTAWAPPEAALGFRIVQDAPARRWWSDFRVSPAWGLAAAALLVIAAAAGLANLEVRYDAQGLVVRTGWGRSPAVAEGPAPTRAMDAGSSTMPWRTDLAALERRLREEFISPAAKPEVTARSASAPVPTRNDPELLRRVQALIDASETRQRRELALRMAQVVRDFDSTRQTDLVRIQNGFGRIEGVSAADRELLNYLVRVSQRPQ